MNISFVKLETEECENCDLQTQHMQVAHRQQNALEPDGLYIYPQLCKTYMEFNQHQPASDNVECNKGKRRTKFCCPRTLYLSVVMQKVAMMPHMAG